MVPGLDTPANNCLRSCLMVGKKCSRSPNADDGTSPSVVNAETSSGSGFPVAQASMLLPLEQTARYRAQAFLRPLLALLIVEKVQRALILPGAHAAIA